MSVRMNSMKSESERQGTASFYTLGIAPKFLEFLERMKFTVPTPIQEKAIPVAIQGKDIIGIAQTGTGKTLAFGIPMLQRLASVDGKGLVIVPTRELALQVDESLRQIGRAVGIKTAVLIGGASISQQISAIRQDPDIIVGTPGRINDHLNQGTLRLGQVAILVLDEADRMFDMGFAPQVKKILQAVPKERQTMLFSATMPDDIVKIATLHMKLPVRVEIARAGTAAERVEQEIFFVSRDAKNRLLEKLLTEYHGSVLVFSRTKFGAKRIRKAIETMGYSAAEIHANRSLYQRREALEGFKAGKYRVLVATDIASRGIDVVGIELVINYDIPQQAEDYVHRIGRTGRAGQAGHAVSFVTPDERHKVRGIERLIRTVLSVSKLPELPPDRPQPFTSRSSSFGERRYGSRPPQRRPGSSWGNPRERRGNFRRS